jgi:hypothetical protein
MKERGIQGRFEKARKDVDLKIFWRAVGDAVGDYNAEMSKGGVNDPKFRRLPEVPEKGQYIEVYRAMKEEFYGNNRRVSFVEGKIKESSINGLRGGEIGGRFSKLIWGGNNQ